MLLTSLFRAAHGSQSGVPNRRLNSCLLASLLMLFSALVSAQNDAPRASVFGIAHAAICVSDLGKARAFYRDLLGFAEPFSLRRQDGDEWIGFIKLNDQQYVELFVQDTRFAGLLNHFAFFTDNAEGMKSYLVSRGIKLVSDLHRGQTGDEFFSVVDPDGHLIEIVQYQPDGWNAQNRGRYLPSARISQHLSHMGVPVASMPAALGFYRDVLGFQQVAQDATSGGVPAWVNVRVPNGTDYLHLVLVPARQSVEQLKAQTHIGLTTASVGKSVADLKSRSNGPVYAHSIEVQVNDEGRPTTTLFDPNGAKIELMEGLTGSGGPAVSSRK